MALILEAPSTCTNPKINPMSDKHHRSNPSLKPTDGPRIAFQTQSFQGPLPHPAILKQFDDVCPGAAEKIIKMAQDQAAHRQGIERLRAENEQKFIEQANRRETQRIWLACALALGVLAVASLFVIFGQSVLGFAVVVGEIGGLMLAFIYGKTFLKKQADGKSESTDKPS